MQRRLPPDQSNQEDANWARSSDLASNSDEAYVLEAVF